MEKKIERSSQSNSKSFKDEILTNDVEIMSKQPTRKEMNRNSFTIDEMMESLERLKNRQAP